MDAILQFTVTNQTLERTDEFTVVEGSENYLRAHFTFTTPDWDGMTKTGVFIDADGDAHPSLCAGDICEVPKEWLIKQKGFVGLIGSDGTTKITTKAVRVSIKEKGYTSGGEIEEETQTYFDQLIAAFAEKYAEAEAQAKLSKRWAVGLDEEPETLEDNAKYYAEQARNDAVQTQNDRNAVSELSDHVDTVAMQVNTDKTEAGKYKEQAATSATNALKSEQVAKTSETAAQEAQAGAESAEGNAELYAGQAAADKAAVELIKSEADKTAQKIAEDKNTVQGLTDDFALAHQQAVADINNAGQAQTERVENAGEAAVGEIKVTRQQAVNSVSDEGESQKNAVKSEGSTQVANVQAAAEEIIADREQIAENKSGISALKSDLANKAPARIMNENNVMNNAKIHSGYYDTKHNDSDSYVYFEINVLSGVTYGFGAYIPSGIVYPRFISKNGVILQNYNSSISGLCQYTPDFSGKLYVTFRSDATDFVGIINNDESSGTYHKPTIKPLKELEEKVSLTDSILTNSGDFEFSTIKEKLKFDYALQNSEPIDLAKILKWEIGGIAYDGSETTDTRYRKTGVFKLASQIYGKYNGAKGIVICYFYDENKKFLNNNTFLTYSSVARRNNTINLGEIENAVYVRFVIQDDSNPYENLSLRIFQDSIIGRKTKTSNKLNNTTKYYFDSDTIELVVTLDSLTSSKVMIYRDGSESVTAASNIGFIDFESGKFGFYKQVANVETTTSFSVLEEKNIEISCAVGRKYRIKSEKIDGNKYVLSIMDLVTMSTDAITVTDKRAGAGWGYRNYKVESGVSVVSYNSFVNQKINPKVLVIGDSYVEGNTLWNDKTKRWCGLLKDKLNGDIFINGQGGANAYKMYLWFYNYLIDMVRPKYVIIHTYTNEPKNLENFVLYTDYMSIMIKHIKYTMGATPILVKAMTNAYCTSETVQAINNWIDASGEKFFDYSECMTVNGDGVTQDTSVYLEDLVHPNEEGHRRIYEKLVTDFPELIN